MQASVLDCPQQAKSERMNFGVGEAEFAMELGVAWQLLERGDGDAANEGRLKVEMEVAGTAVLDIVPLPVAWGAGRNKRGGARMPGLETRLTVPAMLVAIRHGDDEVEQMVIERR